MSILDTLERQLNVWLQEKAPISMPSNARRMLANALWWIALVIGLLQFWAVTALWHIGHLVDQIINYTNGTTTYSATVVSHSLGFFYWLSLWALGIDAVLLLVAAPNLKRMNSTGWKLLYYSALLNALYDILRLFSNVGADFGGFVSTAVSTIIGAYFLFQVRSYFVHDHQQKSHHTAELDHEKKHVGKRV